MVGLFRDYGYDITPSQAQMFERYFELLVFYNERFNITAITEKREVYIKHFIDSLAGERFLTGRTLADVGSGGGFPALPLKIYRDSLEVTLIESTGKKCDFLKTVIKDLKLSGVRVINGRAEELGKELLREKFDNCTARAVARLNSLSEYCMPLVKVGGRFIAYKGEAKEEIKESERAFGILGGKCSDVYSYLLDGARRCVVCVEKTAPTDKKYPRGMGKERKNPL